MFPSHGFRSLCVCACLGGKKETRQWLDRQTPRSKCTEHIQLHAGNNPLFSSKIFLLREWKMAKWVCFLSSFMLAGRKKKGRKQKGLDSPVLQKQWISWLMSLQSSGKTSIRESKTAELFLFRVKACAARKAGGSFSFHLPVRVPSQKAKMCLSQARWATGLGVRPQPTEQKDEGSAQCQRGYSATRADLALYMQPFIKAPGPPEVSALPIFILKKRNCLSQCK